MCIIEKMNGKLDDYCQIWMGNDTEIHSLLVEWLKIAIKRGVHDGNQLSVTLTRTTTISSQKLTDSIYNLSISTVFRAFTSGPVICWEISWIYGSMLQLQLNPPCPIARRHPLVPSFNPVSIVCITHYFNWHRRGNFLEMLEFLLVIAQTGQVLNYLVHFHISHW